MESMVVLRKHSLAYQTRSFVSVTLVRFIISGILAAFGGIDKKTKKRINFKLPIQTMITIEKLLDMGLHLGHTSKQMNPKMRPYICGKKNELQLLDLIQSYWFLKRACHFLMLAASQNKTFLFVSKRKFLAKKMSLANSATHQDNYANKSTGKAEPTPFPSSASHGKLPSVAEHGSKSKAVFTSEAHRKGAAKKLVNVFYVNQRWLGGLLTNWHTVRKCLNKLETLEKYEQSGSLEKFSKKEVATWKRDFQKLQTNLGGLRGMTQLPDIVILLGQLEGGEAIRECKKLNIPTVQLLDTNSDPNLADLFVPFNDDSLTGLHFVVTAFLKAIKKGSTKLERN